MFGGTTCRTTHGANHVPEFNDVSKHLAIVPLFLKPFLDFAGL
jgi:hypothetical protein